MQKLPHVVMQAFNTKLAMVSTSDRHFCVTLDDGETFWEISGRVIDGVLVITTNSEEPI